MLAYDLTALHIAMNANDPETVRQSPVSDIFYIQTLILTFWLFMKELMSAK